MGLIDQILADKGLDMDDLKPPEIDTLTKMLQDAERKVVTVDTIKRHIKELIGIVSRELIETPEFVYYFGGLFRRENRQHVFLKARLKNYLLLENLIMSPELARQQLDEALSRIRKGENE